MGTLHIGIDHAQAHVVLSYSSHSYRSTDESGEENAAPTTTQPRPKKRTTSKSSLVDPFPSKSAPAPEASKKSNCREAGDGGLSSDQQEIRKKAKYLTNWIPIMKGRKMYLEGDLLDFE